MCYMFLNVLIPAFTGLNAPYWTYEGVLGPNHWPKYFPRCGGRNQSPIDIVQADSRYNPYWPPLKFSNYNQFPKKMHLENNGHTAQVTGELPNPASVYGGPLNGSYTFVQFHFHWGRNDERGSEHTVDGRKYASELHFVHYRGKYGSPEEAARHPGGLLVMAVFLEIGLTKNIKLNSIVYGLNNIRKADTNSTIQPYPLQLLLPSNVNNYYTYKGSVTTPTCDEVVTWIVFKDPIKISSEQMAMFRTLKDDEGHPILHNYRPLQNINDRKIVSSFEGH